MCILILQLRSFVCFHVKSLSVIGKKIDDSSAFYKCWALGGFKCQSFSFLNMILLSFVNCINNTGRKNLQRKEGCERTSKLSFHLTWSFLTSLNAASSTVNSSIKFLLSILFSYWS